VKQKTRMKRYGLFAELGHASQSPGSSDFADGLRVFCREPVALIWCRIHFA
jgi:hypothetical protein